MDWNWILELSFVRNIIRPLLDILLMAFLFYQGYKILYQTRALQLIKGTLVMVPIYAFAVIFKLNTLVSILNKFAPGLFIAIAIIFQPELRKIFIKIGKTDWFKFLNRAKPYEIDAILNAASSLSDRQRGCLIVFTRKTVLDNIIETGTVLNCEMASSLILTIFGSDTPLHDGAMIIQEGRIAAAGCFLPLSEQSDIRRSFGTRHRAALGIAEETDAVVLIVSEETSAISLAYDSNLYYDLSIQEIRSRILRLLSFDSVKSESYNETVSHE